MKTGLQRGTTQTPRSKAHLIKLLAMLILVLTLLLAATGKILQVTSARATTGDWPMYLHDAQRMGASADTTLSPSNAGQLTKLWSFKTAGFVESSPAVVGSTVYVGSWDGYEYALDATTGALKWKTYLGVNTANCNPTSAGISSGAAVQNGVVYVGGGDAYWYALDAATGAILWKVYTGDNNATGGHYNWSSPLLYNGYAYIGVASLGDCPLVQGQLLEVSLASHQVVNTFNVVPAGQVGGGIWTSPSIDTTTNIIYVATGTEASPSQGFSQAIVALDASTLTVKDSWKLPEAQAVTDSDFDTTPTLFNDAAGNPIVASINKNGYVYAFNRSNLSAGPLWKQQIAIGGDCAQCGQSSISSGAFGNGTLYLAGGETTINGQGYMGSARALDPATGHYLWQHGTPDTIYGALAYTNGLVIDGAGPALEVLDAASGARLYSYVTSNTLYAAPSISNGQIFTGNVDGYVYAFGLPGTPPPTPTPDPNCPAGWSCQDIGNPTPAGSETIAGSTWNISAGGTGIGGNSDQFRFISQNASGDSQVSADVASQQATSSSAQAGLMVRQTNDPASPYYAVFLTNGNGVVVQYRSVFGGGTATDVQLSTASPPLYLEIQRVGDQFQAATSNDGVNYTLVPGGTVSLYLPNTVAEGVTVSSDNSGNTSTVAYSSVAIGAPGTPPASPPPTTPCPGSWNCSGIGNPAVVGSQALNGGSWTVQGAGEDIWGTSDQFHYVWQPLANDGSMSAHILSQTNTDPWAKAGVMLRQSTSASSAYYAAFITPAHGIVLQYRPAQGFYTSQLPLSTSNAPAYLMVARSGSTYSTYTSSDGTTWTLLTGSSITLNLTGTILAGLSVTSHNASTLSTVTLDTVSISTTVPPPGCPGGWSCADIGNPALAGSQSLNGGTWTVQGAGVDIWGTSDQFHYAWQSLASDGSVSAHILAQTNTNGWAKAGVMLRQSTDPGSAYYGAFVTPGNGIVVQYRTSSGASAMHLASITGTLPAYLMVARSGSTYNTYTSSDGASWTPLAGSSVTLNLNGSILAGLTVTSHNTAALSTVTFDTVSVSTTAPPPPASCPTGWSCADIGNPALAGSQSLNGGTWTIQGAGADIWGSSDQFHYVWQALNSDGSESAHILAQTNTGGWAKAGVMLRQSTDPGSPYYAALVTPGNGINVQYRTSSGASAAQLVGITGTVPTYLQVVRSGSTYSTYTSSDRITWTLLAGSSITLNMGGSILEGLAVASHNTGALSTVTLDTVTIGCPGGWSCADIGNPGLAGSQSLNGGTWTVQGAGADIWGTSDQFHYVWQALTSDGSIKAHVLSQTNTSTWAKAGVMLRQSTDPGSPYYAAFVTPANGINVQYRTSSGVGAMHLVSITGATPVYLMVARSGSTYNTYTSSDGASWTPLAGSSVTLNLNGSILAGLAVTSHSAGVLSSVTFDTVSVSTTAPPPASCPTGWSCADIGNPALAGSQSLNGGTWTIQGAGADIWGTSDQFHYAWQALNSDGSVSAHILSQTNTGGWAKAGVMLRQSSDPGSPYYAAFVTPTNGIVVQYRSSQGGNAAQLVGITGTTPAYFKVVRSGSTYSAYTSNDGITWTLLAGSSITLNMSGSISEGLAVASHNTGALSTVTFDTVGTT